MAQSKRLKCTAHAHVEGEVIKAGTIDNYDEPLATRLLTSTRFEVCTEEEPEAPQPKTVADYQAALTELGVEFETDANKAALVKLYEEATAE